MGLQALMGSRGAVVLRSETGSRVFEIPIARMVSCESALIMR